MKKRTAILVAFLLLCTAARLSAQQITTSYTRTSDGLTTFVLENGMEVYLLETSETPVAQVIFAVKAGYSCQTPETTGVPELYSRLFFNAGEKGLAAFTETGARELYSSCYADVVHYSLQCPDMALSEVLASLAQCAILPRLSNTEIKAAHTSLLEEKQQWADSASGYINSATDTIIFNNAPWQFDTGIFPESFEKNTTEELRGMLAALTEKYYTPNNSALFIATSRDKNAVLAEVKELYGSWKRSAWTVPSPTGKTDAKTDADNAAVKKYALVCDDFSLDFNQFIVQYTGGSNSGDIHTLAAWQTAALVLQQNQELAYRLTSGTTGIEDYSLYNIAFTQSSSVPRIIFQCLSDSRKQSPDQQAAAILEALQFQGAYTEAAVAAAREQIASQAVSARTRTQLLLEAVALNWAYGGASYFYDFPTVTAELSPEQVAAATEEQPVLFVLLHTRNWEKHRKTLESAGFTLISRETAAWYAKDEYRNQRAVALGLQPDAAEQESAPDDTVSSGMALSGYSSADGAIYTTRLSNGIPVLVRREPRTQGVTIRLTVEGGETRHPVTQRGLETATIQAAAENIRKNISSRSFDATVTEKTGMWQSDITITTAAPYAADVIAAIGKALFFESITTSQADGIMYNMQYQWRLKQGSLDFQMLCAAMQYCYGDGAAAKWYTSTGDILAGVTMPVLTKSYAELLDPQRYTIILTAEAPEQYIPRLENVFGSILSTSRLNTASVTTIAENPIHIPDSTNLVTVNHIFTTDIKAEDAGPRPLHLIPTTKFDDPVHYYFSAPSVTSDQYPLFMALMYELEENLNHLWKNGVELHMLCPENPIIQVIFKSVPQKTDVFPLFAKAFNVLQDSHTDTQILLLKSRAIPKLFSDNTELMEQGWLYAGTPSIYTRQYQILEMAAWDDFDAALDVLRPHFNILELLSDTRNLKQ